MGAVAGSSDMMHLSVHLIAFHIALALASIAFALRVAGPNVYLLFAPRPAYRDLLRAKA